jgi:hypothetical protein
MMILLFKNGHFGTYSYVDNRSHRQFVEVSHFRLLTSDPVVFVILPKQAGKRQVV